MADTTDKAHWTRIADQWIAWARSPGHDAFWAYRDALVRFIGPGRSRALDIGCGEGRVSRELRKLGYHVTASDAVEAMVEAARHVASAHEYAIAGAASLPFESSSFDLVVAYNVLMDVDDVPAAVREARRVLKPNGVLFISLVHPFRDRGRFVGPEEDAPFVLDGTYYGRVRFEGEEEQDGLHMHFAGWSQPLESYVSALESAGLAITALREPVPDLATNDRLKQWTRVPLFLWLKARILA